jgi:hypothetical protein
LSFDSDTGILSGSPINAGVYQITISATNATGTGQEILTLFVSGPEPAPLPASGGSVSAPPTGGTEEVKKSKKGAKKNSSSAKKSSTGSKKSGKKSGKDSKKTKSKKSKKSKKR